MQTGFRGDLGLFGRRRRVGLSLSLEIGDVDGFPVYQVKRPVLVPVGLPALLPREAAIAGHDEIGVAAAAFRAAQPFRAILARQLGAVALDVGGDVGLDLMPTRLAPRRARCGPSSLRLGSVGVVAGGCG